MKSCLKWFLQIISLFRSQTKHFASVEPFRAAAYEIRCSELRTNIATRYVLMTFFYVFLSYYATANR